MPLAIAAKAVAEKEFLQQHWPDIIQAQGKAPTDYTPLEASLAPQDCGVCHVQQWQDWQGSRHSRSMGPGVMGQLQDPLQNQRPSHSAYQVDSNLATLRSCSRCHAPLYEQQAYVPADQDNQNTHPDQTKGLNQAGTELPSNWQPSGVFDQALQHQGLVCAVCHVRRHQRLGPPRLRAMQVTGPIDEGLPHGGFIARKSFSQSEFCSHCHQFNPGDFRLNGKLIENTFEEWRQSDYPAQGKSCQSCHMPGRRHLWRGIHDVDMVRQAVTITARVTEPARRRGERLTVKIELTNSGAGHYFPTYMTPKVFVRAELIDAAGRPVADTWQEAVIGRDATLDLSQELYDTRIAPHDSSTIIYQQQLPEANLRLKIKVVVEPDHYYEKFYRSMLSGEPEPGREMIERAFLDTQQSHFTIYEQVLSLTAVTDGGLVKEQSADSDSAVIPNVHVPSVLADKKPDHHAVTVDWNDEQIEWFSYADGLEQATKEGRPILMVLYADWCPTCHAYKNIFYDPAVVAKARKFVMVRVNVEQQPVLNKMYAFDGDYVPRVILMDDQKRVRHELYAREGLRYFVSAEESGELLGLMGAAM